MSQPFVGEIRMVGFNFAPVGWAFCNGALMSISENEVLFTLIGTTYGGNGTTTFALPNLQSRVPVHMGTLASEGTTFIEGQTGGVESVTITNQQMPVHTHPPQCNSTAANSVKPTGNYWANWADTQFSDQPPANAMNTATVGPAGGSQPHDNMLPFLAINFIISLFGIFPSQN
jgi:microcystin-dependent protein